MYLPPGWRFQLIRMPALRHPWATWLSSKRDLGIRSGKSGLDKAWMQSMPIKKRRKIQGLLHGIAKKACYIDGWWNSPWLKAKVLGIRRRMADPVVGSKEPLPLDEGLDHGDVTRNSGRAARSEAASPILMKLCEEGELDEACQALQLMGQGGVKMPVEVLVRLLQGCINKKDLAVGRRVHSLLVDSRLDSNVSLESHIIRMYDACGCLVEAKQVFDTVAAPDRCVWAAIILAHDNHGQPEQVLKLYHRMQESGVLADGLVFVSVLKACSSELALTTGKLVHAQVIDGGYDTNVVVGNALIKMYAKCGSLEDAQTVFERLTRRNLVSWNTLIAACARHGDVQKSLNLFEDMVWEGVLPNKFTFVSIVNACSSGGFLDQGKVLHCRIRENGLESDVFVGNALICMYSKSGSMKDARDVFDRLAARDLVSWNTMIAGYVQHSSGSDAIQLFSEMQLEGIVPDEVTLISMLKACGGLQALEQGKQIHAHITARNMEANLFIGSALIDMYAKCGSLADARRVFDRLVTKDVITWNTMISRYSQHGAGHEALLLFQQMIKEGMEPDKVTLVSILKACAAEAALEQGKLVQSYVDGKHYESNVFMGSCLMDMYAKCGNLEDAHRVFQRLPSINLVAWNILIAGYAQVGNCKAALGLFEQMVKSGVHPDEGILINVLKACSSVAAISPGRRIHGYIIRRGLEPNVGITSALVDMYAKSGSLEVARRVFDSLAARDVVSWNAMVAGYAQHGNGVEAFQLFRQMQENGQQSSQHTLVSMLKACSSIAALHQGKLIHSQIIEHGWDVDLDTGIALVTMYTKCGSLEDARKVFDRLQARDVVLWNAMLAGYAQQGFDQEVLVSFEQMKGEGIFPSKETFVSLLSACSHEGLLQEGHDLFQNMSDQFGMTPEIEHYVCMVELLGRCGYLSEAEELIKIMPMQPDASAWMSLLRACQAYENPTLGRQCFEAILNLDPRNTAVYTDMSNIYSRAGRYEDAEEMAKKMQQAGGTKEPNRTWIEFENQLHSFLVNDMDHPERSQIHAKLKSVVCSTEGQMMPSDRELDDYRENSSMSNVRKRLIGMV